MTPDTIGDDRKRHDTLVPLDLIGAYVVAIFIIGATLARVAGCRRCE